MSRNSEIGKAYISQSGKALIISMSQPGKLSLNHFAISLSALRKVLAGEKHEASVLRVHP